MEKQRWEESENRRKEERRSEKRKSKKKEDEVREKVGKSQFSVCFSNDLWLQRVEGRVRSHLAR